MGGGAAGNKNEEFKFKYIKLEVPIRHPHDSDMCKEEYRWT